MLTLNDPKTFSLLDRMCSRYRIDPTIPSDARHFFSELLSHYSGTTDSASVTAWLSEQIPRHFVALRHRPRWIQNPEWPFADGKPMIFVGQFDLSRKEREKVTPTLYHDDTTLYMFVGRGVEPVVIIQQY